MRAAQRVGVQPVKRVRVLEKRARLGEGAGVVWEKAELKMREQEGVSE